MQQSGDSVFYDRDCYDQYLENATWRRAKDNDDMISCTEVVSVSTSCSRCSILASFSCTITWLPYGLQPISSCLSHIYSVDTILYPYALPLIHLPIFISSLYLRCNLSSMSKGHDRDTPIWLSLPWQSCTPVSISILKPPLGAIGAIPLKPQASPIVCTCI